MSRISVRALAFLLLAAPASAQLFSDDEARERLASMEERMAQLEDQLRALSQESAALTLEKQKLLAQLRTLSGVVEETNVTAARQATRIGEVDSKLSAEINLAEKRLDKSIEQLSQVLTDSAKELYGRALDSYTAGNVTQATQTLDNLLVRYPASSFEVPARYWLARFAVIQSNQEVAKDALLALLAAHPDHPRIPDIIVLLAEIAAQQGQTTEVFYWRNRLIERHPSSTATDFLRLDTQSAIE